MAINRPIPMRKIKKTLPMTITPLFSFFIAKNLHFMQNKVAKCMPKISLEAEGVRPLNPPQGDLL
jgi:hypothetical protein